MRAFAITLVILSLLCLSLGQHRHGHGAAVYRHRVNRDLKLDGTITISDASLPERTEIPEVVVYVDQYGNTITTLTEAVVYIPKETSSTEPSSLLVAPTSDPLQPPVSAVTPVVAATPVAFTPPFMPTIGSPPEPTVSPPTAAFTSSPYPVPSGPPFVPPFAPPFGASLHGVTYSPYRGDGNCKTADEVDTDFALFAKDYGVIRIYGVDCNQVYTVSKAARKYGNKLFLGIFNINSVDSAVATMASGLYYDWSVVDTVSVGNELVGVGGMPVDQSLAALTEARSALRAAGYQGPVVVVDTFAAVLNHPELCDQSDYCAVNIHPFFDGNTEASEAGSFVNSIVMNVRGQLSDPSKRIVVTETGWPWQGEAHGAAIPGLDQQSAALSSIKSVFSTNPADVFLFTAFNDMWKKAEPGTYMAEQFWGMGGRYSPSDHQ